jgi:hypothetical protein
LSHLDLVDVRSRINRESIIICFENIIKRFYHCENAVRINVEMLDEFNRWVYEKVAIQERDWLYVRLNDIYKMQIHFRKTTTRHTIKRWLTRWIIDDWVNIKFLFWSWNVCATSREFSNALSISECLISSMNWELNMRISNDTFSLLTDWKTSFSIRSLISFCLNAANWEKAMWTIESSLETTAKAKMKARLTIVLNTKLKYAIDARYFRSRSRSRLSEFKKVSWFESSLIEIANWTFDEKMIDDFEINTVNDELTMIDDEFSKSIWSSL